MVAFVVVDGSVLSVVCGGTLFASTTHLLLHLPYTSRVVWEWFGVGDGFEACLW